MIFDVDLGKTKFEQDRMKAVGIYRHPTDDRYVMIADPQDGVGKCRIVTKGVDGLPLKQLMGLAELILFKFGKEDALDEIMRFIECQNMEIQIETFRNYILNDLLLRLPEYSLS